MNQAPLNSYQLHFLSNETWRPFANAISPALPPPVLGSSGSPGSGVGVSGMSPRPLVVAPPSLPVLRGVSLPGVFRPTLLVRRLGRGVGCPSRPSGRFRPVGLASGSVVHQRQGTVGRTAASSPVPVISTRSHGGCLLRQHHRGGVSPQRGRHKISSPQLLGPRDLALDRVSFHPTSSSISSGLQQCPRGRLVSPHQLPHSKWSLNMTVFRSLRKLWPVQIDMFATSDNRRCSIYFSPFHDPMSAGTDAFLQSWDGLQAYAFPPVAIIPRVLAKLRASTLVAPHWAQRPWFSDLLQLSLAPPVVLPSRRDLLRLPRSRHLYPDLPRLRLHAWRLSSDLPELLASPPSILARRLSGAMVHLSFVVSRQWPFCFSSYLG